MSYQDLLKIKPGIENMYRTLYNVIGGDFLLIAINYTTARQNLKEYCDKTVNDFETVIITRERGENVVLISENEYNNMLENLYIRSNHDDYLELLESVRQLNNGQNRISDLVEYE
jgi:antitoxin YefM